MIEFLTMRMLLIAVVGVWLVIQQSSAQSGPGLMERIVESPFVFTQRGSPAYDVGRCLVAARFGDSRQTVSAYIDGTLLLGSVIPFAGWGIAAWRGYRAAEAAAALVEKGGRLAKTTAKMRQRYQVIAAEQKAAGKVFSRIGTAALTGAVVKTGRDCYASCYENILQNVTRSVEGQLDCKKITRVKGDLKSCAVQCARALGRTIPGIRVITPTLGDDTINNAVESVR